MDLRGPCWEPKPGLGGARADPMGVAMLLCRMAGGFPTSGGAGGVGIETRGVGLERRWSGHSEEVDGTRCMLPPEQRNKDI